MAFVSCTKLNTELAKKQDLLKTPSGNDLPGGTCVMSCAEVNAAVANKGNVSAGTNVTLSGNGTSATPYVIGVPNADGSTRGAVSLATASEYPNTLNDTEAATPAYVAAAIAALPGDKYLQGLQSYNAATNMLTLSMSDGSTVPVDLTGLLDDAVASSAHYHAAGTNTTLTGAGSSGDPYKVNVPAATDTTAGVSSLAVAANYPSTSDTEAATPAFVAAAIAAIPSSAHSHASGTNTTLAGTGTSGDPYKVNVNSAPTLVNGSWEVKPTPGGKLGFYCSGNLVASLDCTGVFTASNDVKAFCTP